MQIHSFKARRLRLCMRPLLIVGRVMLSGARCRVGVYNPLVRFLLAPLEIPNLANAQPSNFGPLPYIYTSLNLKPFHLKFWKPKQSPKVVLNWSKNGLKLYVLIYPRMNEWFGDIVLLHFVKLETLSFIVLEAVSKSCSKLVYKWSKIG